MVDIWVAKSQQWLNATYTGVNGFRPVVIDGSTGWQTMYALTRALQHELGITSLSDNFGAGTAAAFTTQIGTINSSIDTTIQKKLRVVAILQCAVWCKGFSGDEPFGTWTPTLAASIRSIRGYAGLSDVASVDVKLMKSLLTMDAYTTTAGGSELVRAGQRWLNSKYVARSAYSIVPCDGHFTRDVNTGLIFGIQYEIGLADEVANGFFGDGTRAGVRAQATVTSGSTDSTKSFVSLFQLSLAFNGYDVERTGTFNAATRLAALDFQRFLEIAATGIGDYGTWSALLASTGDPARPVAMIDTNKPLTDAFAVQMRDAGYSVAGRYLTVTGKSLIRGELDILFNRGFSVVPIFQNYNDGPQYFSEEIGLDHGRQAATRARMLGFKDGVFIFFAVDYDAFASEIDTLLTPYFQGVAEGLRISPAVHYRIGIYGTRNVTAKAVEKGLADAIWVSGMSTGYSGNLGIPMPATWWYNQIFEDKTLNIDRNAVSSRAQPASRSLVARTPDQTEITRTMHWDMVRQEMLAEQAIARRPMVPMTLASTFVLFYLMSVEYSYGPFLLYTLFPEQVPGLGAVVIEQYALARGEYNTNAGIPASNRGNYEGDLEHLAVVAQGINYWGACQGDSVIAMGDLGGWSVDIVQHWADYLQFAAGSNQEEFANANIGAGTGETTKFGLRDLIADADGWLVGRDVRNGISVSESMGSWIGTYPNWETRFRIFLQQRFSRSGVSLYDSIHDNILSIYAASWPWPAWPRGEFQDNRRDPDATERAELARVVTRRFMVLAGLTPPA